MQLNALVGENLEELGITKHSGPRYSTYATLDARLKSYNHWPVHLKQTPKAMAQAGFFHLGTNYKKLIFKIFWFYRISWIDEFRDERPCQLLSLWIGVKKLGTRRRPMA